nr:ribonuclease H-like domain-containing protein [Tanacetum cinerariifolium]
MYNKACYAYESFNHLQARGKYHQRDRMVNGTNHSKVNHSANTVPKAVLTRTGLKPVNFVRPVNPKRANNGKVVKASACWVWRPIKLHSALNILKKRTYINAQGRFKSLEDQGYFDSGCSRHMTRNISYLTDFKEFDGGYAAFEGGAKGGKINCKGIIRTANESHVLLKVPRKNNMYSVDMKNIVPKKDLTYFVAKATNDESMLWHRRFGHINFKNINKLVKENLVKATKDETSRILKSFITEIENLVDKKIKIIRCDNGTKFKNRVRDEFCEEKGIKMEYSVARTPQQNKVAERRNRTQIEAARTMLTDSKLPTIFWTEVVNTACYVQNRCWDSRFDETK